VTDKPTSVNQRFGLVPHSKADVKNQEKQGTQKKKTQKPNVEKQ
jgi:hypothetical protein